MKKLFFLFSVLASVAMSAQTLSIKIAQIDYATKIATCDLSWTGRNATHLSDVWVFVDYIEISGSTTTGSWKPAAITGATVTKNTVGSAVVSIVSGNTRGVWVKSNTSGANFTGQVSLQLNNIPEKFNACAYASDYPPNATINNGTYTLHGTPPFTLKASNGTTTQTVAGTTITVSALTITPVTMTDKTECPGVFCAGRDEMLSGRVCCAGLTAVGSYCRDLSADDAVVYCNLEIKKSTITCTASLSTTNHPCPLGWRPFVRADAECIILAGATNDFKGGLAADVLTSGWGAGVCCTSCAARYRVGRTWGSACANESTCGGYYRNGWIMEKTCAEHLGSDSTTCVR
jgi:hypothetical protein